MKQIQMLIETDWKEQMEQLRSQQKGYVTEEGILDETGWEAGENIVLREKDGWFVEWKKHTKKIFSKKKKWGEWDELEMFRDDDTVQEEGDACEIWTKRRGIKSGCYCKMDIFC